MDVFLFTLLDALLNYLLDAEVVVDIGIVTSVVVLLFHLERERFLPLGVVHEMLMFDVVET